MNGFNKKSAVAFYAIVNRCNIGKSMRAVVRTGRGNARGARAVMSRSSPGMATISKCWRAKFRMGKRQTAIRAGEFPRLRYDAPGISASE